MKKMMDIRDKIVATLEQKPGDTFSVSQIARAIGSNNKATGAALSKLFKKGLVARPQKGLYSSKARPAATKAAAEPSKRVEPLPALSVVTIDLLIEEEKSKIDVRGLLQLILKEKAILDAKMRKIVDADRTKLKIRLSFQD